MKIGKKKPQIQLWIHNNDLPTEVNTVIDHNNSTHFPASVVAPVQADLFGPNVHTQIKQLLHTVLDRLDQLEAKLENNCSLKENQELFPTLAPISKPGQDSVGDELRPLSPSRAAAGEHRLQECDAGVARIETELDQVKQRMKVLLNRKENLLSSLLAPI